MSRRQKYEKAEVIIKELGLERYVSYFRVIAVLIAVRRREVMLVFIKDFIKYLRSGLRTKQLISPTRSYPRREQIAPTRARILGRRALPDHEESCSEQPQATVYQKYRSLQSYKTMEVDAYTVPKGQEIVNLFLSSIIPGLPLDFEIKFMRHSSFFNTGNPHSTFSKSFPKSWETWTKIEESKGSAGPAFSFSVKGEEKNLIASDSSILMKSIGTLCFMTLKNPNSSQALTTRFLESGLERSITGTSLKNEGDLQEFLTIGKCSIAVTFHESISQLSFRIIVLDSKGRFYIQVAYGKHKRCLENDEHDNKLKITEFILHPCINCLVGKGYLSSIATDHEDSLCSIIVSREEKKKSIKRGGKRNIKAPYLILVHVYNIVNPIPRSTVHYTHPHSTTTRYSGILKK
ncbi:hypothetical protein RND71_024288 [Anisodus tanguticus]|uniref:Uncharacterized protein n=1 Tax=Anisodus tanguticus TaxID=243964 RepID=A0AAE1RQ79_9SOLA|nr:hypothetical protein RND71_024288 [Anisodus tanguticus]